MSAIRVVLIGRADMLQDIIRGVLDADPALDLVGEAATVEELATGSDADVVIIRPLSADVPAGIHHDGRLPAVLGVDTGGRRGVVVVDDLSQAGLVAAVRAAAELRGRQEAS